jgi:hypothetical protein
MSQVIRYLLLCVGEALAKQLASELQQVQLLEDASSQRVAILDILSNPAKLPLIVKALSTDLEVQAVETRGSPQPRTWMASALHQFCQEYSSAVPGLQQLRELNDMYFNANHALPTADVVRGALRLDDADDSVGHLHTKAAWAATQNALVSRSLPTPAAPFTAAGAHSAGAFGPEGTLEFLVQCGRGHDSCMVTIVLKEQGAHRVMIIEGRIEDCQDRRHVRVMPRANMDESLMLPQRGWVLIAACRGFAADELRALFAQ